MKSYIGIKFTNGTNDVVPKSWISLENGKYYCQYPNDPDMATDLTKQNAYPDEDWKTYKVTILAESSESCNCINISYAIWVAS